MRVIASLAAARTFSYAVHVREIRGRDRIAIETHDRIGHMIAFVGLHPRFDAARGAEEGDNDEGERFM